MAKVTIPIAATLTRENGSPMVITDLSKMDAYYSLDGGANFTHLPPLLPTDTQIVIDGIDPGMSGLLYATETDNQATPVTSGHSLPVTFTVPAAALAAPNPPTLGTAVIS